MVKIKTRYSFIQQIFIMCHSCLRLCWWTVCLFFMFLLPTTCQAGLFLFANLPSGLGVLPSTVCLAVNRWQRHGLGHKTISRASRGRAWSRQLSEEQEKPGCGGRNRMWRLNKEGSGGGWQGTRPRTWGRSQGTNCFFTREWGCENYKAGFQSQKNWPWWFWSLRW